MRHLALVLALLAALAAFANSYIARGVVVSVVPGGARAKQAVVIRSELSTPRDAEDCDVTWEVPTTSVILLDGQKADFTAFAPGRLVILCKDSAFFRVYTRSFHFAPPEGATDPANAWWTVTLKGSCAVKLAGATKDTAATDIVLHALTKDGAVIRAAGVVLGWGTYGQGPAWHAVDATGLSVVGGRLTGMCGITLQSSPGTKFEGDMTEKTLAITLAAPVAGDGTFAVTDGPKGKTTSRLQTAPVIGANWYAFLRAPGAAAPVDVAGKGALLRAGFRLRDGKVEGDFASGHKLGGGAKLTSVTATLVDGVLKAEIGFAGGTSALDAFVIGDRFFGTYATTAGEKTWTGHASGYLVEADAPTANWGEGDARRDVAAATRPAS